MYAQSSRPQTISCRFISRLVLFSEQLLGLSRVPVNDISLESCIRFHLYIIISVLALLVWSILLMLLIKFSKFHNFTSMIEISTALKTTQRADSPDLFMKQHTRTHSSPPRPLLRFPLPRYQAFLHPYSCWTDASSGPSQEQDHCPFVQWAHF